ncbi:MAG: DinB family protein [Chitinophagales bacterium]
MTESAVYANVFDKSRELTRFYLSNLKSIDPYLITTLDGKTFNSIYWHVAHLIWAEDALVVRFTGGEPVAPDWIKNYELGSSGQRHDGHPDFKSLLQLMKEIHAKTLVYMREFPDARLSQRNTSGIQFGDGDNSNRMLFVHAIRHEGVHAGHLGWLAKMHGIKLL